MKVVAISAVTLEMVEFTSAEKSLRHLIAVHDCDPLHQKAKDHQTIKANCRQILKTWMQMRRVHLAPSESEKKKEVTSKLKSLNKNAAKDRVKDLQRVKKLVQIGTHKEIEFENMANTHIAKNSKDFKSDLTVGETQNINEVHEVVSDDSEVKELLPSHQIKGTGLVYRDSLRQKLVDLLCSRAQEPSIGFYLTKETQHMVESKNLVDRALRLENKLFKLY